MSIFNSLNKKQKYFALFFLIGFLLKYNYSLIYIFNAPSVSGIILRNLICLIFIIYILVPQVKMRKGRIFILILSSLFSTLFLANLWYNRHFGNYLSFADMTVSEGIGSPMVLFRQIMKLWDIIFIIDLIILAISVYKKNITDQVTENLSNLFNNKKRSMAIIIFMVVLLVAQVTFTNLLLGNERPRELYNKSTAAFVNVYGIVPLYFYEFYRSVDAADLNETMVDEALSFKIEDEMDGERLIDKDSNIIVIQLESFDNNLLDYKHNGRELTPFLNQLKDKSLYGNNIYAQHVNGSFDADFSFLTSLYPVNKNYVFRENDMSKYNSVVKVLEEKGYRTMAFHGNNKRFFNRGQALPVLGFDEFYSREDFSNEEKVMNLEESYLGINDYDFFKQSLDHLEDSKEPFFAYMITVTSHTPFDFYPEDQSIEEYSDIKNKFVADYFNSISFLDKSLKMFFEELERRGLIEDTLVVIYGDHEAGVEEKEYQSSSSFEVDKKIQGPEHIPLLIKHPDLETGIIEKTGTVTDIAPTILDIIGAKTKPKEFMGYSLLKGEERPVPFIHESPQILYKGNLFVQDLEGLEELGYLKGTSTEAEISEDDKYNLLAIIEYMKQITWERRLNEK